MMSFEHHAELPGENGRKPALLADQGKPRRGRIGGAEQAHLVASAGLPIGCGSLQAALEGDIGKYAGAYEGALREESSAVLGGDAVERTA